MRITRSPLQDSYGGNFDLRGCRDIASAIFAHDIPAFYCRYADGVKIDGLEVEWAEGCRVFRKGFNLRISALTLRVSTEVRRTKTVARRPSRFPAGGNVDPRLQGGARNGRVRVRGRCG